MNPVDEKRVRDFELDTLGAEFARHDRFEPCLESLLAPELSMHRHEDLRPDLQEFFRLHGLAGHFQLSLLNGWRAYPQGPGR